MDYKWLGYWSIISIIGEDRQIVHRSVWNIFYILIKSEVSSQSKILFKLQVNENMFQHHERKRIFNEREYLRLVLDESYEK